MKIRIFHPVFMLMPLLMLIAAFGLDILEAQMGRKYGPVNTETYIWSLDRIFNYAPGSPVTEDIVIIRSTN